VKDQRVWVSQGWVTGVVSSVGVLGCLSSPGASHRLQRYASLDVLLGPLFWSKINCSFDYFGFDTRNSGRILLDLPIISTAWFFKNKLHSKVWSKIKCFDKSVFWFAPKGCYCMLKPHCVTLLVYS